MFRLKIDGQAITVFIILWYDKNDFKSPYIINSFFFCSDIKIVTTY